MRGGEAEAALTNSSYVTTQEGDGIEAAIVGLRERLKKCGSGEKAAALVEKALGELGFLRRVVPDRADGHLLAAADICAFDEALEAIASTADWLMESGRWSAANLARYLPRALAAGTCRRAEWREPGVRVMSVHEARAHAFPVVFVCDLVHGSFPVSAAEDAFLDEESRRALEGEGLRFPPARPSLEEERLLFYLAVTRARERLYLSRSYLDEKGRPVMASPFWNEVMRCLEPGGKWRGAVGRRGLEHLVPRAEEVTSSAEARLAVAACAAEPESEVEAAGLALVSVAPQAWMRCLVGARPARAVGEDRIEGAEARLLLLSKREGLSATLLERYAACPFQCYCEDFLRLGAAEGFAATLGSVLHDALSSFFRRTTWKGEAERTEEARQELLQAAEEAIGARAEFAGEDYESRYVRARALDILGRFVEAEIALRGERKGRPAYFEVAFPARGGEALKLDYVRVGDGPSAAVLVGGRIDRVDVYDEGGRRWCVVVDYKTRDNSTLRARTIEQGYSLQLPLYLMALERAGLAEVGEPVAAEWYCLDEGVRRRVYFSGAPVEMLRGDGSGRWEAMKVDRAGIEARVVEYVDRLRQGDIKVDPHPESICEWCDFKDVCRIREKAWGLAEREEE